MAECSVEGEASATASRRFRASTDAPSEARGFVAEELRSGSAADRTDDVALIVSELVTNAVLHTPSAEVLVEVAVTDEGRVRCAVTDEAPDAAASVRPVDATRVGGHGLVIVEGLASRWGCDRGDATKSVWFELEPA